MIILYAIPFFVLLIIVESLVDWKLNKGYVRFNDAVNSLSTGMLSRTMGFLTIYVNWAAYSTLFSYFGWYQWESTVLVWLAAFVIYDFFYYWSHRLGHIYSLFWNSHAVHHQSEEFNLTTALRQPFTGFVKGSIVYIPMIFMGFDPIIVATVSSFNLIYQFWVHTRFIKTLGFLEWFMVTPSNHRVHHGMNDDYIDKNFGGVFIIWDRIFNTFQAEKTDDPAIFGVRKQLNNFNPFFANFQIYLQMVKDIWVGKSLRLAFAVIVSKTGQRPDEIAIKAPVERLNLDTFKRYDPKVKSEVKVMIWSQLIFTMLYTVWFMLSVKSKPFDGAFIHFLPLGFTLLSMGYLLENKLLGWWLELSKLVFISASLWLLSVKWPIEVTITYVVIASLLWAILFRLSKPMSVLKVAQT